MQLRTYTYPLHLANRLETGVGYDVVFVTDLDGAIAVRSRDEVLTSTCRAVARAGFEARRGPRGVSAAELPLVAPNLLWVNPTAADLSRLRWSLPPGHDRRVRERGPVKHGSAALHEARPFRHPAGPRLLKPPA
jgi:hypothetical protein